MTVILQDTFTRANVTGSWGTATDGNTWTTQGLGGGTVQVSANEGQVSNTGSGANADLTLGTTTSVDGDVTFRWKPSNASDDTFGISRFQSISNFYYMGQDLSGVEAIKKRVSGSGTTITSKTHTLTANSFYWTHTHVQGSTLSVRIWLDGATEPAVWDLTTTDTTYTTAGNFGFHISTFTTSNTINLDTFSVDNLAGHSISGSSRSKYLMAMAVKGMARAGFAESIASFGRSRSRFTESIAARGAGRTKFTEAIGSTGRIRARFIESQALKGRIRSRFYEAAVSKGQARAKFAEAIAQKPGARSKFLVSKAIKGLSRSSYLVSKASRGLARSKFTESIAQRGQARSRFSLSAVLRGLAESTFKIAVAGGHAITAYMRSHYKVSIRQIQAQHSRFLIRFSQSAQVHSKYLIRFAQAAQSRTRFLIRFGVTGRARSRYVLSIRQAALARSRFITRLVLVVRARSKFLVQGILVTLPIKSITHSAVQALSTAWNNLPVLNLSAIRLPVLSAAWRSLSALSLSSVQAPALTIVHQGIPMPAPNTTILSTITVTDTAGAPVSNASTVTLVVYFPDGSTSNLALTSGITNLGAGQYQAKYNTKQPGEIREVWSIIGADGTTLASAQFLVGVEY